MTELAPLTFDYSTLEADVAAAARTTADRIRTRLRTAYVDTGRDLIAIKDRLGHGHFGVWLKAEFDMTERAAWNYMNAARWLEGKSETVSDLPAAAVYALAAPSAPAQVVNEVIAAVEAGVKLPTHKIKEKIAEAAAAERQAQIEAAKSQEQKKKEQKARESRAARQARMEREERERQEAEARREQERRDRLTPLVQRIVAALAPDDLGTLARTLDSRTDYATKYTLTQMLCEQAEAAQ